MAHIDQVYNKLVEAVLRDGFYYSDQSRAGIRMLQIPHYILDIDMSKGFPLITTKRISWKTVAHELIWMLSGSTNIKYLQDNGVKIWNKDAANFKIGDGSYVGRIYGAQWRDWRGHNIMGLHYLDQINNLIQGLKNNLYSRRHIVTAWNPTELEEMALPPCHWSFEILPVGDTAFELKWHQRSCDTFLGIPFDIALYAMLGKLIQHETGLQFTRLIGDLSNVHFYEPHIVLVHLQIRRSLYDLPKCELIIDRDATIYDLSIGDLNIQNYYSHDAIKADMYAKVRNDENI